MSSQGAPFDPFRGHSGGCFSGQYAALNLVEPGGADAKRSNSANRVNSLVRAACPRRRVGAHASAGIILFTDPQSFFQSANIESTETFDEIPSRTIVGVGSVALGGPTYTSAYALAQWYTFDSFVTPSPPNGLTQKNVAAPATLTFANGGNTGAIGFYLRPGQRFRAATTVWTWSRLPATY